MEIEQEFQGGSAQPAVDYCDHTTYGLWAIALGSPLVSLLALFFIRSSIKSYKEGENPDIIKSQHQGRYTSDFWVK